MVAYVINLAASALNAPWVTAYGGTTYAATATTWIYANLDGSRTSFTGTGFSFDATGAPTAGRISVIERISAAGTVYASLQGFVAGVNDQLATIGTALYNASSPAAIGDNSALSNLLFGRSDVITNNDTSTRVDVRFDLRGGDGDDTVNGGGAAETIYGGTGADVLRGAGGADLVYGGAGDDVVSGGVGSDSLYGGDGIDVLDYGESAGAVTVNLTTLMASGGDALGDIISGFEAVIGGLGNDALMGDNLGSGNLLMGGSGNDLIEGLGGADYLLGGPGYDTVSYSASAVSVTVNLTNQTASGGDATGDVLSGFEAASGGAGNDVLIGDATVVGNILTGNAGNDYFYCYAGADTAYGGAGVDILLGGGDNDSLYGGDATDYIYGGTGTNQLFGDDGVDVMYAEGLNDTLFGGSGGDYLYAFPGAADTAAYGGDGNDIYTDLTSNGSADLFFGDAGQDYFYGNGGGDTFYGGAGVDVFLGGDGDDLFDGGEDVDYAWGGAGDDGYVVGPANGHLVINDFAAGGNEDAVLLEGTRFTTFAQIKAACTYYAGLNTTIMTIDADTSIWFVGVRLTALTTDDFYLL
jgi:Ca2+-binding RTX toxin-like protein